MSTEQLLEELLTRFDHGGVTPMRVTNGADSSLYVQRRWKGNPHTVIGLAQDLADLLIEDICARFKLVSPGQMD